jgi:hypothetical protein
MEAETTQGCYGIPNASRHGGPRRVIYAYQ